MSSKIRSYPGTSVERQELEAGKFLVTHYETVLRYSWTSGVAISRFLDGLKEGELWARRCDSCRRVLIPPRMYCEECWRPTDSWVRVKDTGKVNTFSISYVNNDASRRKEPLIVSVINIDGASPEMGILHFVGGIAPEKVEVGMKVRAEWKPREQRMGAITDIIHFRPV